MDDIGNRGASGYNGPPILSSGPLDAETIALGQAIAAKYGLLEWTSEKPTVAGWYWCKKEGRKPCIVKLSADAGNGKLVDSWSSCFVENWKAEWAGPIQPPKEK